MSKMSLFIGTLAVAVGFSTAVLGQQSAAPAAEIKGDAARGKELFIQYTCYGCHGFSAQNGPGRNRLNPMTMTVTGFMANVRGPASPTTMPPFSAKVISDQQLADIWTYVKTLPNAPAAKDIPLLQQIKAEATK
jgi:mono/diheme cytochrome c family protein